MGLSTEKVCVVGTFGKLSFKVRQACRTVTSACCNAFGDGVQGRITRTVEKCALHQMFRCSIMTHEQGRFCQLRQAR